MSLALNFDDTVQGTQIDESIQYVCRREGKHTCHAALPCLSSAVGPAAAPGGWGSDVAWEPAVSGSRRAVSGTDSAFRRARPPASRGGRPRPVPACVMDAERCKEAESCLEAAGRITEGAPLTDGVWAGSRWRTIWERAHWRELPVLEAVPRNSVKLGPGALSPGNAATAAAGWLIGRSSLIELSLLGAVKVLGGMLSAAAGPWLLVGW